MRTVRAQARLAPIAAALGVATVAVALAVSLPGPSGDEPVRAGGATPAAAASAVMSEGYNGTLAGAPIQRARCEHWLAAAPAQRLDAVRGIATAIGGPSSGGGVGVTLTEAEALRLFNRTCATRDARGFALYLIYARAAAFSRVNVQPPADPGDL